MARTWEVSLTAARAKKRIEHGHIPRGGKFELEMMMMVVIYDDGGFLDTWQGWVLFIICMVVSMAGYACWDGYKEKKAKSWPKTFKSKSGQRYTFRDTGELHNAVVEGNIDYNAKTWPHDFTILLAEIGVIVDLKDNGKVDEAWIRNCISWMLQRGGDLNVKSNKGLSPLGYAVARGNEAVARILREYGARS
jgi:hypothetical protein